MMRAVWVGFGGALGSVARYGVLELFGGMGDGLLPWGTLTANLAGSLILGLVIGRLERRESMDAFRLFLTVGVLGGFTTFSFFSYENLELLREDRFVALLVNAGGQVALGLAAAAAGYRYTHGR